MSGAFCTQCKERVIAVDRAPHIDCTVAALGQLEESQRIPDCGRSPLNGTAKGLRGQAGCCWLAASSSLGHLGPRPSRETPRLRPASGLCAWSRWRGGGSGMAAIMSSWPGLPWSPVCPFSPRGAAGWRETVQGLAEGTRRPLPRSCAGREISNTAGFPEVGRFHPWLCCLSSRVSPGSACDPGM